MRKGLSLVLSVLVVLSLGVAFVHCGNGDDNGDKCEGGAECCPPTVECPEGEVCNASGVCETAPPCEGGAECCENQPCTDPEICAEGVCEECCPGQDLHGFLIGAVRKFPTGEPVQVAVAVVGGMAALMDPDPEHIGDWETTTDANGGYRSDCLDFDGVAAAAMILSDDEGFDGNQGDWYPTYSGVMEIVTDADRTCEPEAPPAWAMPNDLVGMLAQLPTMCNSDTPPKCIDELGFAVVIITDAELNPVEGATLTGTGGSALPGTTYPSADFSAFDGTATSANGIVLIRGPLGYTVVEAHKTGMTWEPGPIGAVAGFCFTRPLVAE